MGLKSRTKTVSYQWHSPKGLSHEPEATAALAAAQRAGVVAQWDGDTSWHTVWLTGWPGAELRALRDRLTAWWGPSQPP